MNHKIEFKKRCEKLNEAINFLVENDIHFSVYSNNYIDGEYFNFSNTLQIWKEKVNGKRKELYLEINKKEEALYIYADDYSAKTGQPDKIIQDFAEIKKYLLKK